MKICRKCGIKKNHSDFYTKRLTFTDRYGVKRSRTKRKSRCKRCLSNEYRDRVTLKTKQQCFTTQLT